jgi:hypothetical protein
VPGKSFGVRTFFWMTEKKISSGKPRRVAAPGLPQNRPCPLSGQLGSSKPLRLQTGQKRRAGAVPDAVAAVCVYEVVCDSSVRGADVCHAVDRVLADRLSRDGMPLLAAGADEPAAHDVTATADARASATALYLI